MYLKGEVEKVERWEGGEVASWERCEKGKVTKVGGSWFIQGRGMQGESKTSCFCF